MGKTKLTFLGTGTSQGVPMIGCRCSICSSPDNHDKRLRSSALVECGGQEILIDAGPDFRCQMLRAGVSHLDAILLTHNHKDHTGGLDDVRAFNYLEGLPAEIYCEKYVEKSLRREYSYAFADSKYPGAPEWHVHNIGEEAFTIYPGNHGERLVWVSGKGYEHVFREPQANQDTGKSPLKVIPIRGMHGSLPVLGYRFGNIAYCTDMNHIPEAEFSKLEGLEHFVVNCVTRVKHQSHFSLEEAIEISRKVGARHSWLTHLSHRLPCHSELCNELPENIRPAFDGLVIEA
ncbi:MAG: MBL fold metallo-hydrolase [Clostridium sp.]|nr:MBL fold metallo-hydrolase [Bacteroides sp.]MCM1198522.1 MBL fold metallo-hydrolase [Clostridium sp.]